jgi:hypothetical protein
VGKNNFMRKCLLLIYASFPALITFRLSAKANLVMSSKPAAATDEQAEQVKKSLNPVADLFSAPFQNNFPNSNTTIGQS